MKQQTAVEWLHENNKVIAQMLLDNKISQSIIDQLFNCFVINLEQAKQMEKQQMRDVYMENVLRPFKFNFEEYYNETYGSKGSKELSKVAENTSFAKNSEIPNVLEISDEEIEEASGYVYPFKQQLSFIEGAKWYREQLKKK